MAIPRFPYIRSSSRRSRRSCWDSGGETELGGELNSSVFVSVFPAQDTIKLLWADPNVFALDLEARSWRRGRGLSRDTKRGRDVGKGYRISTPASDKHRYSTPNAWVT